MKKRIVSFVGILLTVMLLFSSCGSDALTPKKIDTKGYLPFDSNAVTYTTATQLSQYGVLKSTGARYGLFQRTENGLWVNTVLDLYENRVVGQYSCDNNKKVISTDFHPVQGKDYYTVLIYDRADHDQRSLTLYAPDGKALSSCEDPDCYVGTAFDLLYCHGTCYRIAKDGTVKEQFAYNGSHNGLYLLGQLHFANGEYYYRTDSAYETNSVEVYDSHLNHVSTYLMRSSADGVKFKLFSIMENGMILVQYLYVAAEGQENSFLIAEEDGSPQEEERYYMESVLVNPKTGQEEKTVKLDFVVGGIQTPFAAQFHDSVYSSKWKGITEFDGNLARIGRICDGVLIAEEEQFMILDNSLKVEYELSATVEGQQEVPKRISKDRYLVSTFTEEFLVDGKGNVLKTVAAGTTFTELGEITSSAVYDWDGNLLLSYQAEGYTPEIHMNACSLFSKDGEYYLLRKDKPIERMQSMTLEAKGNTILTFSCRNAEGKTVYRYYNNVGNCILESEHLLHLNKSQNSTFFYSVSGKSCLIYESERNSPDAVYYLVTAD